MSTRAQMRRLQRNPAFQRALAIAMRWLIAQSRRRGEG